MLKIAILATFVGHSVALTAVKLQKEDASGRYHRRPRKGEITVGDADDLEEAGFQAATQDVNNIDLAIQGLYLTKRAEVGSHMILQNEIARANLQADIIPPVKMEDVVHNVTGGKGILDGVIKRGTEIVLAPGKNIPRPDLDKAIDAITNKGAKGAYEVLDDPDSYSVGN